MIFDDDRTPKKELRKAAKCKRLVALALAQNVAVLLQRTPGELGLLPQVGGEEAVGVADGREGRLEGVLEGLGRSGRGGVDIGDTGQLTQTLDGWGGDKASTTWGWNKLQMWSDLLSHSSFCIRGLTLTRTEPHLPLTLVGRE